MQTAAILLYQFSVESVYLWRNNAIMNSVFVLMAVMGLGVMSVSVKKYFFKLSGVNVFLKKESETVLETSGLHAYVRHPLYAGTLLFAWSVFLIFPLLSYLVTCVSITAYTIIGVRLEEKKLVYLFGQQYHVYKNNVPMIIPFTKFGRPAKPVSDNLT